MGDAHQEMGWPHRPGRPTFDLIVSKLRPPPMRPGSIDRSPLIERLADNHLCPIVSVVAPAGYGKTTLLAQWAERNGQSFAWVSLDERDNDPRTLLTYIAAALDEVEPIEERVFEALASYGSSVPGAIVPRLGSALVSMSSPVVLVLDDVHVLHERACRDAVSTLADHLSPGSQLVLAGRIKPPLRIGRLRAEGKVLEIGPADLSLTREEAASLLRNAGAVVSEDDATELHRRTEGWPTGLYLAALYVRQGGTAEKAVATFGGGHRLVSGYMESQFLAQISADERVFLTRTAVLERMSGLLCDAALEQRGSAATLAKLARSNLLLVPLDQEGKWYRYHHLFGGMLRAELRREEPDLMPVLRRRAASWCAHNGLPEEALAYSIAAGDVDAAARLVEELAVPVFRQGRIGALRQWFRWLDDRNAIEARPLVAVMAAIISAYSGHPADADRWADVVDRWQYQNPARADDPPAEAWAAVLRATLSRHGIEQLRADADEIARRFAASNMVDTVSAIMRGAAQLFSGDLESSDASFEDAVSIGEATGATDMLAVALCERSLLAMTRGEWDQAEAFAGQARTCLHQGGMADSYVTPLVCAVHARVCMHRGDVATARQELTAAQRQRHLLTYAVPKVAIQARIELARVYIALADPTGARTLMREVNDLLKLRPGLGTLVAQAEELRVQLSRQRGSAALGASALTDAELRLLPLLATYLSFPEIADDLALSRSTVKVEAISIYQKLGVSSRSQAVAQARRLGLLD